jgi:hypothetical protein
LLDLEEKLRIITLKIITLKEVINRFVGRNKEVVDNREFTFRCNGKIIGDEFSFETDEHFILLTKHLS